jgi:ADP-ribosylglycohydrolase
MYGAIIGDVVGSVYEGRPIKTKQFPFLSEHSRFTDDTVMTCAVASAFLLWERDSGQAGLKRVLIEEMQRLGRRYPHAGYGGNFKKWLGAKEPKPYGSFGNGSAMRVSPVAWVARSLEETLELAEVSASVSHDHPEGIKGAQATAGAIYLARTGASKTEIKRFVEDHYYDLSFTLEDIRPHYGFDVTCQCSVPESIAAFLEAKDFEETIRNAVSLGGDSDTQAAIAGSIAQGFYGVPNNLKNQVQGYLDEELLMILSVFREQYVNTR